MTWTRFSVHRLSPSFSLSPSLSLFLCLLLSLLALPTFFLSLRLSRPYIGKSNMARQIPLSLSLSLSLFLSLSFFLLLQILTDTAQIAGTALLIDFQLNR